MAKKIISRTAVVRAKPATQEIKIENVRRYLIKKGWECVSIWQKKIEYYEHVEYPEHEIKLTVSNEIKKFGEKLIETLKDICEIENKKWLNLVEDIAASEATVATATPVVKAPVKVAEVSECATSFKHPTHKPEGGFAKGNRFAAKPVELHMASIRKHRILIADRADELIKRAMDLALTDDLSKTNVNCLMDLLKLYIPAPKSSTFVGRAKDVAELKTLADVKEYAAGIISDVEASVITIEESKDKLGFANEQKAFIEAADIEPRMREIELAMSKAKGA